MEETLNKVSYLIENSVNIPEELKPIVKAICQGYIRESHGKIPIEGIINVCDTTFIKYSPNDKELSGENNILGYTHTKYNEQCEVKHIMGYNNSDNYIKLITILTHELGHVITEPKPNKITADGIYPVIKKTSTFCIACSYEGENLLAKNIFGVRIADGFLESISSKIFSSQEFRQELLEAGYDLKDYSYKDKRLFPSRIYDEYKACFELFDYIMNGALFDFSCTTFSTNEELKKFITTHKLNVIFSYLDKSNDALWALKKYEGQPESIIFQELLNNYRELKNTSLNLAYVLLEQHGKSEDDPKFQELYRTYEEILQKQTLLPLANDSGSVPRF